MPNNNNREKLYPLKFKPILKPAIWGGTKITKFKNLSPQDGIGESWEISGVRGDISVVSNGPFSGTLLNELLSQKREQLVGEKVYQKFGDIFPLLFKFIDARRNLSIQVHPNDRLAKERHNSFGKSEMWYVVDAAPGAFLYTGFKKKIIREEYKSLVADNRFVDMLNREDVKSGDVFYLPAGRVHAIGAGCFIAEIQQTSDVTYRIFDYNRKNAKGEYRELHTELAEEAIDFELYQSYKTGYVKKTNQPIELVSCPYFTTNLLEADISLKRDYSNLDSFIAYMCIAGDCKVIYEEKQSVTLSRGESLLIPSDINRVMIKPNQSVNLLETYII